jgi:hypothetical protein
MDSPRAKNNRSPEIRPLSKSGSMFARTTLERDMTGTTAERAVAPNATGAHKEVDDDDNNDDVKPTLTEEGIVI